MKTRIDSYVEVNGVKYLYSTEKVDDEVTFFECRVARISQEFATEDISAFLIDLPDIILESIEYEKGRNQFFDIESGSYQNINT